MKKLAALPKILLISCLMLTPFLMEGRPVSSKLEFTKRASKKRASKKLTVKAEQLVKKGKYADAYTILEKAISLDLDNSRALKMYMALHEVFQVEPALKRRH